MSPESYRTPCIPPTIHDRTQTIKRGKQLHALPIGKLFGDQREVGFLLLEVFQAVHD